MVYRSDGTTAAALDRAGLRRMAALMGEAFMEHDNWKRVIAEPERRRRALCALFGFMGAVVNRHGHVVEILEQGRAVGYITFMECRDRVQVSFLRIVLCGGLPAALRFLVSLKPAELAKMAAFNKAIQADHGAADQAEAAASRGLHLYTAAMDPAFKGQGLMKRSFAWMEEPFAEAGFGSYMLETSDPSNLPVYRRFGLEDSGSVPIPGQDRRVWFFRKTFGNADSNS